MVTLYRKREDGSLEIKVLSRSMFSSVDEYVAAVDHAFDIGFDLL